MYFFGAFAFLTIAVLKRGEVCPMPYLADALFGRCPMPYLADALFG
jgi:hypothetical protein